MTDPIQPGLLPPAPLVAEFAAFARELATTSGTEIHEAVRKGVEVEYKTDSKDAKSEPTNPVSEVDRAVEAMIRERVRAKYPDHTVIGEEVDEQPKAGAEYMWIVDPLDGTTNFVNKFPMFAASVGLVHNGLPVAGAVWCSTSHALMPGTYHASTGGSLMFEDEAVDVSETNRGVLRRLSAAPGGAPGRTATWDNRVTGSAALECAFVASGVFTSGQLWGPSIWDVAGGVVLLQAAGRTLVTRDKSGWLPFQRFEPPSRVKEDREPTLRDWRRPLLMGTEEAVTALQERFRRRPWWQRMRRR
jgi:myo-inositol-1(or 4)-monophosphatase